MYQDQGFSIPRTLVGKFHVQNFTAANFTLATLVKSQKIQVLAMVNTESAKSR